MLHKRAWQFTITLTFSDWGKIHSHKFSHKGTVKKVCRKSGYLPKARMPENY